MNSFHHHWSIRNYYSFENKGCYLIHNKSYVGFYANKTSKNEKSQVIIHQSSTDTNKLCAIKFNNAIDYIGIILPSI